MCGSVKLDGRSTAVIRPESAVPGGLAVRFRSFPDGSRPCGGPIVHPIELPYGSDEPLLIEPAPGTEVAVCEGPEGATGAAALELVNAALASPADGPPLDAHVVAGDRTVVAVAGAVPQVDVVMAAVAARLTSAGVEAGDVRALFAEALEPLRTGGPLAGCPGLGEVSRFDPGNDAATAYLVADEAGNPLYLARALVDADVVVAVGGWVWNAALGGRSLEGEIWPAFGRRQCRQDLVRALARRGRHALADWRTGMQDVTWQLGVCAGLRLVPGRDGTIHAAFFGLPDAAGRQAKAAAAAWCPQVDEPAELSIASLSDPYADFGCVTRAVAAAGRVTHPGGTICVVSRVAVGPGLIFLRWRQGAPLEQLVHEAVATGDQSLIADALQTRLFARALGERRLVLLSDLEESAVEELGFGHAATPDVVDRLVHRADSLAVLREADLMLPNAG